MSMDSDWRQLIDRATPAGGKGRILASPVTDLEWTALVDQRYIHELEDRTSTPANVAQHVRTERRTWGKQDTRSRRQPEATGDTALRVDLLSRLYAFEASQDSQVVNLRIKLDGHRLRALGFHSPGRPDLAGLVPWIRDRQFETLGINNPSDEVTALTGILRKGEDLEHLYFPGEDGSRILSVPQSSMLGEVARLANALAEDYRWREADATRWLLCEGVAPRIIFAGITFDLKLGATTDTRSRIVLTLDPALSSREVATIYAQAKAAIAPGQRVRGPDAKALALASFVIEQPEPWTATGAGPWDTWLDRWNRSAGKHHGAYDSKVGGGRWNFRRDARAAYRRLTHMGWRL